MVKIFDMYILSVSITHRSHEYQDNWFFLLYLHYFQVELGIDHLVRRHNPPKKLIFLTLVCTLTSAYLGSRNVSFSVNFEYVLNKWSLLHVTSQNWEFSSTSVAEVLWFFLMQAVLHALSTYDLTLRSFFSTKLASYSAPS